MKRPRHEPRSRVRYHPPDSQPLSRVGVEGRTAPAPRPIAAWAVLGLAVAYAAVFTAVCVSKYRNYLYDDFDLAIFAQAAHQILHGSMFISIRGMNWLGDHASLILFPIAPIYALFPSAVTLLVLQSVVLALGAWPVFHIARRELKHDGAAVICAALYLLHPAIGYTNVFEFHPETIATTALLFVFQYALAGRMAAASIAATLALACREDVGIVVLAIAVWLAIRSRESRPLAAALAGLGALSLAVSFGGLRPAFNRNEADYAAMFGAWGSNLGDVARNVLTKPHRALEALFATPGNPADSLLKRMYHVLMLAPLGFLPLASPGTLLIALPIVLVHFLSGRPAQHQIVFQYTALVTPILVVAAIRGAGRLSRWLVRGDSRAGALATGFVGVALAASVVCNVIYGPLTGRSSLWYGRPPQRLTPDATDRALRPHRDRMLAAVPDNGAVVAGFEFLSHLANRSNVHAAHHVYAGTYTFSTRPYPTPSGVSAVLADPSNPRLYPYLNDSTAERMTRVFGERNLRPAMAAGDLTLWLPGGADTLVLPRPARAPAPIGRRVTYDQTIALLGRAAVPPHAARGDLIPLPLQWMRVAPTDRRWVALFALANGKQFRRFIHPFGGAAIGPERWPEDVPIDETYRMLIPMDAEPGLYEIGVVVGSLSAGTAKPAVADDPEAASQGGFVTLGTVEISAR